MTLAALMTAVGVTKSKLSEQRIVVYGAGTAGLGITKQLRDGMGATDGLSTEEANKRFYLLDRYGLIKESLGSDKVRPGLREFVRPDAEWADVPTNDKGEVGLLDVVRKVRPTVLIGCSTHAGAFTEEVVKEMARGTERPIIFPLSNPTRLVEVTPEQANEWTNGKALMASGSPFPPCKMPNGKMYEIAECNSTSAFISLCDPLLPVLLALGSSLSGCDNEKTILIILLPIDALIYPGLGFGAMITQARKLSDTMIIAGAQKLASLSPALKDPDSALLPDFAHAREVNTEVAVAVAEQAIIEGEAGVDWDKEEVRDRIAERQWIAEYPDYVYDPKGEH